MNSPFAKKASLLNLWLWAVLVGVLSAAVVIGFRGLIQAVEWLATGHGGSLVETARALLPWRRALVSAVGGLLAGLVLHFGQRWAAHGPAGDRHVDYIDAVRSGEVLNDRTTLTRTASALVSVGTGASIGREGPMVQMAAWSSARLASLVPMPAEQRNALLVCGIAAGIGSTYHAPLAGVVFVLELALGFFAGSAVAPVLISSATASALVYWLVETKPLYSMPTVYLAPAGWGMAMAAGVVCGILGACMLGLLKYARSWFGLIRSLPVRLGLGGVLVGLVSAVIPEVWGNGYEVVSDVLQGSIPWTWVMLLFIAKVAATSLSGGSGAIGGVFTPTLFVGATGGYVMAHLAESVLPAGMAGDPRAIAVVGMAAVLSGTTHAPLMAIVMVLEMTGQFHLLLPVMLASGIAYAISSELGVPPMYGNPIEAHQ